MPFGVDVDPAFALDWLHDDAGGFVSVAPLNELPGLSISNNTWPKSNKAYPKGVVNRIGDKWYTADEWEALPFVENDKA